jgi:hypothetical protein
MKYFVNKLSLIFLCLTLSGCGPDFGDKIYEWIENNAKSYSEKLTRADLRVRWTKSLTEHYKTITYHSEVVKTQLNQLYNSTENSENRISNGLGAILIRYDHSKSILNDLLQVKSILEKNNDLFKSLDSIGNGRQFEAAGLRAIGKETLMRSFIEIGNVQATVNRLRYQKLFSLKYSIAIGENGNVSQSIDRSDQVDGYSYSGSFEGFWLDNPITGPIFSLFIKDDIEEQVERIWEALDRFDELCLKPEDQFKISQEYLKEARVKYADHHKLADSIHVLQKENWLKLYQWNVARFKQAESELQPYKLRLTNDEFQGSEAIKNILSEEARFKIRQELIGMVSFVRKKIIHTQKEIDKFKRIENIEGLERNIIEAIYILNVMSERKELISLQGEIKQYKSRIKRDSIMVSSLKKELIIKP